MVSGGLEFFWVVVGWDDVYVSRWIGLKDGGWVIGDLALAYGFVALCCFYTCR